MQAACAAAERATAAGPTSSAWIVEGIRQLERSGFLEHDRDANVFTFHQTLREHAECAASLPSRQHAAGLIGLLHFYAGYLRASGGRERAIERCFDNALAVMEAVWAGPHELGLHGVVLVTMVDTLGFYFQHQGLDQLGDHWNERAITLRRRSFVPQDENALAHGLYRRAGLLSSRGQYEQALQLYGESLGLSVKTANVPGQSAALHAIAIIKSHQDDPADARWLL